MNLGQTPNFEPMGPPIELMTPPGPPIGPYGEPYQPPVPRDPVAVAPEPLTIDITGGREMTWWEANQAWVLPVGFVLLVMAANR